MNFPKEIIGEILYFSKIPLLTLKQVDEKLYRIVFELRLGNETSLVDFEKLITLTEIKIENGSRQISDRILVELTNLTKLSLMGNGIDISVLLALPKLRMLEYFDKRWVRTDKKTLIPSELMKEIDKYYYRNQEEDDVHYDKEIIRLTYLIYDYDHWDHDEDDHLHNPNYY